MFYINPGELRTNIRIQTPNKNGEGSFAEIIWKDIIEATEKNPNCYIKSSWTGLKGAEKWAADSMQAVSGAIVTVRYNAKITECCRVVNDEINYEIVDISDPTQRKQWMQITVKAAVNG